MDSDRTWTIVVGVDGSEGSSLALDWAAREAAARRGRVEAVIAWQWSTTEAELLAGTTPERVQQWSEAVLDDAVRHTRLQYPEVSVTGRTMPGDPADVLTGAARDADLLVIGSHGHGRLYHALLGSVAERCIRRSPCAVTVVPTARRMMTVRAQAEAGALT